MRLGIRSVAFFLLSSFFLHAKESVTITKILDANLFQTTDGRNIALTNVLTYSIHDADTLKAEFARTVIQKSEELLLGKTSTIKKLKSTRDSLDSVFLWIPALIGKRSINSHYLYNGWGMFNPYPDNAYVREFSQSSRRAKAKGIGIYKIENLRNLKPLGPNAFWLSTGIGFAKIGRVDREYSYYREYIALRTSISYRHKFLIGEFGGNFQGTCCHSTTTYFAAFGVSLHDRYSELTFAVGPSVSRWSYNTESEYGTINSDNLWGPTIKVQGFIHASSIFGAGVEASATFNDDQIAYLFAFNLYWGEWNLD